MEERSENIRDFYEQEERRKKKEEGKLGAKIRWLFH